MRSQKEPGGARRSQEGSKIISAGARRNQDEPAGSAKITSGGAMSCQEELDWSSCHDGLTEWLAHITRIDTFLTL